MEPFIRGIIKELNDAGVRHVIVGGVAVVLRGYARLTIDLDLVIDLSPQSATLCIEILSKAGLRPRAPVDAKSFADPRVRQSWIDEKNMQVFSMFDSSDLRRTIDLFATYPVDFEELWNESESITIDGTEFRVASVRHLIQMKRRAGRLKDLDDIAKLERIEHLRKPKQ